MSIIKIIISKILCYSQSLNMCVCVCLSTGLIATSGDHWHHMRRFTLRHLKDLGMGKSKLVDVIQYEATALVEDFKKHAGKPGRIPKSITVYVLNIIWQMVASKIKF